MGVADGVYMWREQGIDSGLMSRSIMESCRQQVAAGEDDVVKSETHTHTHTHIHHWNASQGVHAAVCSLCKAAYVRDYVRGLLFSREHGGTAPDTIALQGRG